MPDMQIKPLTPTLSSSPQLEVGDLLAARDAGYRSILCARPDDENPAHPSFANIAAEAEALGLQSRHVPIPKTGLREGDAADFNAAYDALPKPVLAYCASGRRIEAASKAANLT